MPNNPILIHEIVVNGRTLRAEPPLSFVVKKDENGTEAFNLDFHITVFAGQSLDCLRHGVQARMRDELAMADRYRQRFKEVE